MSKGYKNMECSHNVNSTQYLLAAQIPFLDFVRCMATLQIVLFHYVCAIPLSDRYVLLWGREGVALFFMISGAGLVNKYYYNMSALQFYKRRLLGIFIPFWIAYLGVSIWKFFVNSFTWTPSGLPLRNGIFTFLGIDGLLAVYGIPTYYQIGEWYLGVLLIVYLLFPIWIKAFRKYPTFLLLILLALRILISANNIFSPLPVCYSPITALSNFSIGAYSILLLSKAKKARNTGGICVLVAGVVLLFAGWILGHRYDLQDYGELLTGVALFAIYYILAQNIHVHSFRQFVCYISYEVFLLHHVIIYKTAPIVSSNYSVSHMLIGAILTFIVIAAASYNLKKCSEFVTRQIKTLGTALINHSNTL